MRSEVATWNCIKRRELCADVREPVREKTISALAVEVTDGVEGMGVLRESMRRRRVKRSGQASGAVVPKPATRHRVRHSEQKILPHMRQ